MSAARRRTRFDSKTTVASIVAVLAAAAFLPSSALGHGEEVHTEQAPAGPAVEKSEGPAERDKGSAGVSGSGAPPPSGRAEAAPESETPPAPREPESDPALHFAALGFVALGGIGLLLLRRRRLAD